MQDLIDEARLLNQAYKTLCESGEGWTLDMLAQFRKIVLKAEEVEVTYVIKQETETDEHITEVNIEQLSDHYESKGAK